MGPKDVALALNSSTRCMYSSARSKFAAALAAQIPRVAAAMRPQQLALAAHALAAAAARHTQALAAIEAAALQQTDHWTPQDAALLVSSFAKLQVYRHALFAAAAKHGEQQTASYGPQDLALLCSGLGAFGGPLLQQQQLLLLQQRAQQLLRRFKGPELALTSSALAKLGCTDTSWLHALADEALYRLAVYRHPSSPLSFSLFDLQQLTTAFIKMHFKDPRLFAVIAQAAKHRLRALAAGDPQGGPPGGPQGGPDGGPPGGPPGSPQGRGPHRGVPNAQTIACLLHAFGRAGVRDKELLSLLERQVLLLQQQFSSAGLGMVAAAAAALGIRNQRVWGALQQQGALRGPQMPLDLVVLLLTAVSRGPPKAVSNSFLRAAAARLRLHILSLPAAALAAAVVAFERVGWRDTAFLARAARLLQQHLQQQQQRPQQQQKQQQQLSTRALCGAFSAFAKLAYRDPRVYVHLGKEIYQRLHQLTQEDAAT
ncbi:hypothetical protein, conserved, partial [Eimeria tenella]